MVKLPGSTSTKKKRSVKTSGKSQNQEVGLFLDCPICHSRVIRSNIERHVERCLQNQESTSPTASEPSKETTSMKEVPKSILEGNSDSKLEQKESTQVDERKPLADRLRPTSFDQLEGNKELFGKDSTVRILLERDPPPSFILCGPPGCGKTTVAYIISKHTKCPFKTLSCCTCGIDDVNAVLKDCEKVFASQKLPTILFLDEIHRFNRKQQDVFLPFVESGKLVMIGATTENPSFSITSALLSRCRVFPLQLLKAEEIRSLLTRALDTDTLLKSYSAIVPDSILENISVRCDGDARTALNILDSCCLCASQQPDKIVTQAIVDASSSEHFIRYDKFGEEHHNTISALHKAIRGSDAHGALYWLGRMIEGGEDPLYIARRMIRCATEDVGLSDPLALQIAVQCYSTCKVLGRPLCNSTLAQCVSYLAMTSKSNELYIGYGRAVDEVHDNGLLPVPKLMESQESKAEYESGHSYLPELLQGREFIQVERALKDLREQSYVKYMDPSFVDKDEMEPDGNMQVLPLEKRVKLTLDKDS